MMIMVTMMTMAMIMTMSVNTTVAMMAMMAMIMMLAIKLTMTILVVWSGQGTSRMTKSVTAVGVPQSTAQHLLFLARYWTAQSRQAAESQQEAVTGSLAESWMEALFFGERVFWPIWLRWKTKIAIYQGRWHQFMKIFTTSQRPHLPIFRYPMSLGLN